jgi:hypothetical protein
MSIKSRYFIYLGEVGLIVLAKKRGCDSLIAKYRGQASLTGSQQHPATNNTFYGLSMAELSRLASEHEANLQHLRQQSFENELGTGGWADCKHEYRIVCNNLVKKL